MAIQTNNIFNGIYYLNQQINPQTLFDAIKARICKAEALANIAASTDFEAYNPDTVNNYLWAISDFLQEINHLQNILGDKVFNFDNQR